MLTFTDTTNRFDADGLSNNEYSSTLLPVERQFLLAHGGNIGSLKINESWSLV